MRYDPELTSVSQPMSASPQQPPAIPSQAPPTPQQVMDAPVRCPHCSSTQFYGGKKLTGMGWTLIICAIVNLFVSFLLMFIVIGFLTIFLTPVLMLIGFYGCRRVVNTCARCRREF